MFDKIETPQQQACARVQLDDEREHADVEGRDLAPAKSVDITVRVPFDAGLGEADRERVGICRQRANLRDHPDQAGVQAGLAETQLDPLSAGTKMAALAHGLPD